MAKDYAQREREAAYGLKEPKNIKWSGDLGRAISTIEEEQRGVLTQQRMQMAMDALKKASETPYMEPRHSPYASGRYGGLDLKIERYAEYGSHSDFVMLIFRDEPTGKSYAARCNLSHIRNEAEFEEFKRRAYADAMEAIFPTPEVKVPPVEVEEKPLHKAGHFPTQWMEEAMDRAEASDVCIQLSVERKGVMVTAIQGDDKYASHVITWEAMETCKINPLVEAIAEVERKLGVLKSIKEKVA